MRPRAAAPRHPPVPVQHGMHRADRGTRHILTRAAQALPDLGGAPGRILPLESEDPFFDRRRQAIRMPLWPPATVSQPVQAAGLVPIEDLVAGLPGDPELGAQPRHLLAIE